MRGPARAERHEAIAHQLSVEFDGVLPRATVEAEVEEAEAELRGQVPPGSLDELLHCLAGYRLRERAGAH
jgi:hypothetical protein